MPLWRTVETSGVLKKMCSVKYVFIVISVIFIVTVTIPSSYVVAPCCVMALEENGTSSVPQKTVVF
jgi:hypothetical protein